MNVLSLSDKSWEIIKTEKRSLCRCYSTPKKRILFFFSRFASILFIYYLKMLSNSVFTFSRTQHIRQFDQKCRFANIYILENAVNSCLVGCCFSILLFMCECKMINASETVWNRKDAVTHFPTLHSVKRCTYVFMRFATFAFDIFKWIQLWRLKMRVSRTWIFWMKQQKTVSIVIRLKWSIFIQKFGANAMETWYSFMKNDSIDKNRHIFYCYFVRSLINSKNNWNFSQSCYNFFCFIFLRFAICRCRCRDR